MIFLGDLACPDEKIDDFVSCINEMPIFQDEIVIVNLEGLFVDDLKQRRRPTLYNNSKLLNAFKQARKVIFSLANNHMYDYPSAIISTKLELESAGFGTFGLYEKSKIIPYEYETNGEKYAFFGHCWRLYTQTNRNTINDFMIVDCVYEELIRVVKDYKATNPSTKVYCFMHWNYDLEVLPFPYYRAIARELIDSGADAVIGSHSHVPQGVEEYKGKLIAYCLGNFYLPSGFFFNGTLLYPASSKQTYGVRLISESADLLWFDTDTGNKPVTLSGIEEVQGPIISEFSQFKTMNQDDYLRFFKNKRTNRTLVPVFGKYQSSSAIRFQEAFAISRVRMAKLVHKMIKGNDA